MTERHWGIEEFRQSLPWKLMLCHYLLNGMVNKTCKNLSCWWSQSLFYAVIQKKNSFLLLREYRNMASLISHKTHKTTVLGGLVLIITRIWNSFGVSICAKILKHAVHMYTHTHVDVNVLLWSKRTSRADACHHGLSLRGPFCVELACSPESVWDSSGFPHNPKTRSVGQLETLNCS